MSNFKPIITAKRRFLQFTALSLIVAGTLSTAVSANAATTQNARHTIYQTQISDVADIDARVLNWRNPSVTVYFDLPDSDWIDDMELLLSARPSGSVSARMPLMISFNGADSIPVYSKGQGFDARVKLNASRIRPRNNKVTFTYNRPAGFECLTEANGEWALDFENSKIVAKARPKSRSYQVREIEERFAMPTAAPQMVSLRASGPHALKLQMLAAQGVGLRSATLPDFRVTQGRSDMEIVMGRRDELKSLITDKSILNDDGPRASLHDGRPMRLVLTGDTDAEVLGMATAFAQHSLPNTRRTDTSMGETQMQPAFSGQMQMAEIKNKAKLNTLPGQTIGQDWGTTAQIHTFNVADPSASSGRVLLRINSSKYVTDDSKVTVSVNGQDLGYTDLDRTRKSVAFTIPQGALQATGNTLQIMPHLDRKLEAEGCGYVQALPAFSLGAGSKIEIQSAMASPMTELSRFAATGAPFSDANGEDTVVVLSSTAAGNKAASLKVLAQLAKVSGHSWTNADIRLASDMNAELDGKNVLMLGPRTKALGPLLKSGPKSLSAALRGDMLRGGDSYQTASVERFASGNEAGTLRLYAARQADKGRISRGGIAALYPSPNDSERLVAVITSSNGQPFASSADDLVTPDHWNQLEGSVTRWNKTEVLMAQTALPETSAMRLANLTTPQAQRLNVEWAGKIWDDASSEARTIMTSAGDKVAELRVDLKDRFSRPLQAEAPIVATPAPVAIAAANPPALKPITVKPVQVADAGFIPAPRLRGMSSVEAPVQARTARPGFKMPKFTAPELKAPSIDWTKVQNKLHNPSQWIRDKWRAVTADRPQTNFTQSARGKLKRLTSKGTSKAKAALTWTDTTMSRPALIVIICFFLLFGLLGLASASDRTGNYH